MNETGLILEPAAAGWVLILSGLVFLVAGFLYTGRAIWKWPSAATPAYLRVERAFVIAAMLTAMVGLGLLERMLEAAGDRTLAFSGLQIYLVGAAVAIGAETYFLSQQKWLYPALVVFVVLAFLAQAIIGMALLFTGLLPAWVGWATLLWNLIFLVGLPIFRPKDIYYPWLHYVAPVMIGIAILAR